MQSLILILSWKSIPSIFGQIFRSTLFKLAYLPIIIMLTGCASFGRGVTEAVLDKFGSQEDMRACEITSKGFEGIDYSLKHAEGKTKVLMVHGVGDHIPGYANLLLENLAEELDLQVVDKSYQQTNLTSPYQPGSNAGYLRLNRWTNIDGSKELLFYELTWSVITADQKKELDYDDLEQYSSKRASINNTIKEFSNTIAPDPLIYIGNRRELIQESVSQAYCWMLSTGWDDFPNDQMRSCETVTPAVLTNAENDDYIFITHSLGSRITIDALQRLAALISDEQIQQRFPGIDQLHPILQNQDITIFMLSNQLPLLQMGQPLPQVVNQYPQYCLPSGPYYDERFASETHIIAFSDPNDLFSYPLEPNFQNEFLDSRLCTDVSNISINLANPIELFGVGSFANPVTAHTGYDDDDRTIALLAFGIGHKDVPEIIEDRCDWIRINDD